MPASDRPRARRRSTVIGAGVIGAGVIGLSVAHGLADHVVTERATARTAR